MKITLLVTLFKKGPNKPLNIKDTSSTHNRLVVGSSPTGPTIFSRCIPRTWVTDYTEDIGNTFASSSFVCSIPEPRAHGSLMAANDPMYGLLLPISGSYREPVVRAYCQMKKLASSNNNEQEHFAHQTDSQLVIPTAII